MTLLGLCPAVPLDLLMLWAAAVLAHASEPGHGQPALWILTSRLTSLYRVNCSAAGPADAVGCCGAGARRKRGLAALGHHEPP